MAKQKPERERGSQNAHRRETSCFNSIINLVEIELAPASVVCVNAFAQNIVFCEFRLRADDAF